MQISQIIAILTFATVGILAAPPPSYQPQPPAYLPPPPPPPPVKPYQPAPLKYTPPKPQPPPVINNQANTCSSGSPFCCSPSSTGGTTCVSSVGVACNTVSICCNNFANNEQANQSCSGISTFQHPVTFPGYPQY